MACVYHNGDRELVKAYQSKMCRRRFRDARARKRLVKAAILAQKVKNPIFVVDSDGKKVQIELH